MKSVSHWAFPFYEYVYLELIYQCLTVNWGLIQGGSDMRALQLWLEIFWTLEVDRKAQVDLMLLAHSGEAGRAEANEILWTLLSIWALKPTYQDLSHKLSGLVGKARKNIDRPPKNHKDLQWWNWKCYYEPRHPQWSPRAVPRDYTVLKGPGGVPLAPPDCWGPPTAGTMQ